MKHQSMKWILGSAMVCTLFSPMAVTAKESSSMPFYGTIENESQKASQVLDKYKDQDYSTLGALGFFLAAGDQNAAAIVANGIEQGWVHLNDPNDAMTMEHFKQSLQIIDDCNMLRGQEGISPLSVDLSMMAISIVQTDAGAAIQGHPQLYYVAENLAWGYQIGQPLGSGNPFDGWYTREKPTGGGHCRNITNSSYGVTGAAYSTNSAMYGTCFGQVFDFGSGKLTTAQIRSMIADYEKTYGAISTPNPDQTGPDQTPDQNPELSVGENQQEMHRLTWISLPVQPYRPELLCALKPQGFRAFCVCRLIT